jgi:hypothetical protein
MYLNPRHFVVREGVEKGRQLCRLCNELRLFGTGF